MAKRRKALLVVAISALAGLIVFGLWGRGEPRSNVPSWLEHEPGFEVPEGQTGFRFYSCFTYVGSESGEVLNEVILKLPWPHVGWEYMDLSENSFKTVYIDGVEKGPGLQWPEIGDNGHILARDRWLENVPKYWVSNLRLTLYREEGGVRRAQVHDNSLLEIEVLPTFEVRYHTSGGILEIREFLGGRKSAPRIGLLLTASGTGFVYPKARIYVSDLRPGEGISVEGYFTVPSELADNVTFSDPPSFLDDNTSDEILEGRWRGDNNYGPFVDSTATQRDLITTTKAMCLLEKLEGDTFIFWEKWGGICREDTFAGYGKLKVKPADWN